MYEYGISNRNAIGFYGAYNWGMDNLYVTIYEQLRKQNAKLILSAPRASGTSPLTGVQSPWVDLSGGYDVALTNAVVNGDFANGITGWTGVASVITAINNTAIVTGNGVTKYPEISVTTSVPVVLNAKYAGKIRFRVTNASALSITYLMKNNSSVVIGAGSIPNPVANEWYPLKFITSNIGITGTLRFEIYATYADAPTANGKVMEVQEVMCIDLTTSFTATREPSIQDIQQAMTKAGVTYWNGTKTLKFTNNAVGSNFSGTQTSGWVTDILACDTGVEHTIVNGLGALGDFEGADLSDWTDGGGGGSVTVSSLQFKTGTKSIRFSQVGAGGSRYKDIVSPNGNKLHVCGWYYRTSGTAITAQLRAFDFGGVSNPIEAITASLLNSNASVWAYGSAEKISTNGGIRLYLGGSPSATVEYHLDSVMVIDKTLVFGAGKEPTQAQMDRLVQWMIARFGYINTKTLKLAWRSMKRLDGSDDFESITNSASMDLGVVAGKEQVWSVLFRASIGASGTSFAIAKNNTDTPTMQYGIALDETTDVSYMILNGTSIASGTPNSFVKNDFIHMLFYRNKLGVVTPFINKLSRPTSNYATTLITRPNVRVGKREGSATHFKGDIALLNLYEADTLDIAKILDLEWKIARDYIYTGS